MLLASFVGSYFRTVAWSQMLATYILPWFGDIGRHLLLEWLKIWAKYKKCRSLIKFSASCCSCTNVLDSDVCEEKAKCTLLFENSTAPQILVTSPKDEKKQERQAIIFPFGKLHLSP